MQFCPLNRRLSLASHAACYRRLPGIIISRLLGEPRHLAIDEVSRCTRSPASARHSMHICFSHH